MPLNTPFPMKNPILPYAWGSQTAIAALMGRPPSDRPEAELWMGAHPKAASGICLDGQWRFLDQVIAQYPSETLGNAAARRFSGRLPYLFKVLAAARPLSIQAHPSLEQAREGFARENAAGIPLDAPERNYRDDNHKPECITALTPFWGLNGFRPLESMIELLRTACLETLGDALDILNRDENGLKSFFRDLMSLPPGRKKAVIAEAMEVSGRLAADLQPEHAGSPGAVFAWITRLHDAYPGDIGVLSPLFLNLFCLVPGEAMFLPAGQLHAYLEGTGIEIMANSDNVLRGGLTPKHMDVPELLTVLRFVPETPKILAPVSAGPAEAVYPTPAREFQLSMIRLDENTPAAAFTPAGAEILLCVEGSARLTPLGGEPVSLERGGSVFVPAAVAVYDAEGKAVIYKAAVPEPDGFPAPEEAGL